MLDRTAKPPFPNACRKRAALRPGERFEGRKSVSLCCTQGVHELQVHGQLHLASCVAGHGWSAPWPGRIEAANGSG